MSGYRCETCGETVPKLSAARKHARQGHKTQREAFAAGQLHTLAILIAFPDTDSLTGFTPLGDSVRGIYPQS